MKGFHIDHIVPLACGGTNEKINLQILCQPCHFEKTKNEQENGYVKVSATISDSRASPYNVIDPNLSGWWASPLGLKTADFEIKFDKDGFSVNGKPGEWDIQKIKNNLYHILFEGKSFEAELLKVDAENKTVHLKINNKPK